MSWFAWLVDNWTQVVIPLIAFLATVMVGFWLRIVAGNAYIRWMARARWEGSQAVLESVRRPFMDWFSLLGTYIAVQISVLSADYKGLAGGIIGTLFVASLAWTLMTVSEKLIRIYLIRIKSPASTITLAVNVVRITLIVIAALIVLDIWGAPTNPILLVLAVVILVAALAFRDTIPSLFSGIQIVSREQIKQGDFIKLESGESGEVTHISWQNTQIRALDGNQILIPNSKLSRTTVTNYGHPLKKAASPFHFHTRLLLRELTGLKARSVIELVNQLKEVPDAVTFYHTHHFLEEQLFLTPEPANDFARWISSTVGNDVLGERLASIDTFSFPTIGALKTRFIEVIEEYLRSYPDNRIVPEGEEFYFIRSVSLVLPTPYIAHDLREFVEAMKKVTLDSIYFHVFEARLRLQKGTNDFSIWMADNLGEKDLADKIARIDPYVYTLENLRRRLIELVEARIK